MSGLPSLLVALGVVGVVFSLLSLLIVLFSGSGLQMDFGWTLGNLVVGVALLVSAAAMNVDALRASLRSGGARRARKYGTSTVVTTVLGIALLGMLGFLGTRYHRQFDWTEQRIHTLSDQSRRVIAGLEADVKVQALVSRTEQAPMRDLLDRYAYESKRFRVEYADPIERPGLVESLGIAREQLDRDGLVRIEIAGEHVVVEDLSEQNVTNALVKLTRTGEKVVYFAQGHGEKAIEGEAADVRDGFKFAAEALRNENYRVEPLLLAQFSEVPEDADVLILAGAERPFLEPELEALDHYLARGGAVFALVDRRVSTGMAERLGRWGVELRDDIVIDRALALFGRAITPLAGRYDAEHPITKDLGDPRRDPVIFHEVRSVRPLAGGEMTEVVATGEASWAETDLARLDRQGDASVDLGDLRGPVSVMVAGRPSIDAHDGASPRLVAVGDANFATNELIHNGRNRDLFLNATNWLMGDVRSISIRPNDSRASRFQLTAEQFQTILSTSLFVLPEAIAVLGVFTWWSRRNPAG